MKLAVLSDIHGNYRALKRCVEYALERGVNAFVFLGDYVGEFPDPSGILCYLQELKRTYTCYLIRGNREGYQLNYVKDGGTGWGRCDSEFGSLLYLYEHLTKEDLAFFESLPEKQMLAFDGFPDLTICHGSPERINEQLLPGLERTYEILEREQNRYLLCGHTHFQGEISRNGKMIWNPGSVGLPKKSGGKSQFMILHGQEQGWSCEFLTLDYDREAMIRELKNSDLTSYAPYWCQITNYMLQGFRFDHGDVLVRAMEISGHGMEELEKVTNACWEQALRELIAKERNEIA